jgi:hypothetical protein
VQSLPLHDDDPLALILTVSTLLSSWMHASTLLALM